MGSRPSKPHSTISNANNVRSFDSSLSSINSGYSERAQTPMIIIDSADGKGSPKKKFRHKENSHGLVRAKSSTSTISSVGSLAAPTTGDIAPERFQTGYPTILGRCYNCGESGHFTPDCKHSQPVKCKSCGLKGHKKEYCKTYSKIQ